LTGADDLVQYRLAGGHPRLVAITLASVPVCDHGDGVNEHGHAYLTIGCADQPARLDLRCVAGLPVVLCAHGDERWLDVVQRLIDFKPSALIASSGEYWVIWTPLHGLKELTDEPR
jgi:hypothetical protein